MKRVHKWVCRKCGETQDDHPNALKKSPLSDKETRRRARLTCGACQGRSLEHTCGYMVIDDPVALSDDLSHIGGAAGSGPAHPEQIDPPNWCVRAACQLIDLGHITKGVTGREVAQIIAGFICAEVIAPDAFKEVPGQQKPIDASEWWKLAKANKVLLAMGRNAFLLTFPLAISAHAHDLQLQAMAEDFKHNITEEECSALEALAIKVCSIVSGELT